MKTAALAETRHNYFVMGGDSRHCATYSLSPPYKGNNVITIDTWRTMGERTTMIQGGNGLSEFVGGVDGSGRHDLVLSSLGYTLIKEVPQPE